MSKSPPRAPPFVANPSRTLSPKEIALLADPLGLLPPLPAPLDHPLARSSRRGSERGSLGAQ